MDVRTSSEMLAILSSAKNTCFLDIVQVGFDILNAKIYFLYCVHGHDNDLK